MQVNKKQLFILITLCILTLCLSACDWEDFWEDFWDTQHTVTEKSILGKIILPLSHNPKNPCINYKAFSLIISTWASF